jgi:hypothetical protein
MLKCRLGIKKIPPQNIFLVRIFKCVSRFNNKIGWLLCSRIIPKLLFNASECPHNVVDSEHANWIEEGDEFPVHTKRIVQIIPKIFRNNAENRSNIIENNPM